MGSKMDSINTEMCDLKFLTGFNLRVFVCKIEYNICLTGTAK